VFLSGPKANLPLKPLTHSLNPWFPSPLSPCVQLPVTHVRTGWVNGYNPAVANDHGSSDRGEDLVGAEGENVEDDHPGQAGRRVSVEGGKNKNCKPVCQTC
jgi:hypothetical protein